MNKTYIFDEESKLIPLAEKLISDFTNRFEGREVCLQNPSQLIDGVRIYEIPPGVIVIIRPGRLDSKNLVRFDIVGGDYTTDGELRKNALMSKLENL